MYRLSAIAVMMSTSLAWGYTVVRNVEHTFYGCTYPLQVRPSYQILTSDTDPDNSPPGAAIAHDCGRGYTAGGSGSYDDPLTFASVPGQYNECEIVWDPYTEKYLRNEDDCATCSGTWIDIWTGSNSENGGQAQLNCEDDLTPDHGHNVIRFGSTSHAANSKHFHK